MTKTFSRTLLHPSSPTCTPHTHSLYISFLSKIGIKVCATKKSAHIPKNLHPPRIKHTNPERKDQFRSSHQQFRGKPLEERRDTLVLHHIRDDPETALWVLKVLVLDTSLDDVERGRNNQRRRSTSNGGDEVLAPSGGVIVAEAEGLFSECRTSEKLYGGSVLALLTTRVKGNTNRKTSRGVPGGSPAPPAIQSKPFIGNNLEQPTAAEGLGVGLALNLENIEGEEDNLSDTN